MAEIFSTIKGFMPDITGFLVFRIITFIILFILFCVAVTALVIYLINRLKYNQKIVIWEEISGNFEPTRKDRAMVMRVGRAGDRIFYIKKIKQYQPMPRYQTGRRVWHFFLGEDRELINFGFKNFDVVRREMGAQILDKEMRYARTSLQTLLKERYEKPNWLIQNLPLIFNIALVAVIMILLWFVADKLMGAIGANARAMDVAGSVLDRSEQILVKLDKICLGGSGYVQAPT